MKMHLLCAGLFFSLSAVAEKVDDHTVLIKTQEAEMVAAIEKAQASLDEFLKLVANPPKGASGFKLKVKITDSHGSEHFWVIPFKQMPSGFVGIVADEPEYVTSVKLGQQINFPRSDITDWGYIQDGKQKGSFTVCVMFKHMPAVEVDQYRKQYGFEC
jgi:uncharacterized protein YegJ (DUF2314 family)